MGYIDQFQYTRKDYLTNYFDFADWFVLFHILKDEVNLNPTSILEVGVGSGILEGLLRNRVDNYMTLDINEVLKPDLVVDIKDHCPSLDNMYDLVVCTQVLEHIEFKDVPQCLHNMHGYLKKGGRLMVTVPHQKLYFMWMIPTNKPYIITMPRLFMKKTIDVHHKWEIERGVKRSEFESLFKYAGFRHRGCRELLYEDYWLLEKV
jgi:predicted SAM-dependent methyltransferase